MQEYQYLIAPIIGWLMAQSIKFIISLRQDGIQFKDAFQSGGMPSSHTALTIALVTAIGINDGIKTPLFAVAATFTAIVMYDAIGVRRATGQQTTAIKELAQLLGKTPKTHITNARGHTPMEVIIGIVVGIIAGLVTVIVL